MAFQSKQLLNLRVEIFFIVFLNSNIKKCQKEYQLAGSFEWILSTANTEFVPWKEPKGFSEQQCYNKKGAKS